MPSAAMAFFSSSVKGTNGRTVVTRETNEACPESLRQVLAKGKVFIPLGSAKHTVATWPLIQRSLRGTFGYLVPRVSHDI